MKKLLAFLISILLFGSLACQTTNTSQPISATLTDPQAESTRVALVVNEQESFYTPDTWVSIPQSCAKSMSMVLAENGSASSGTVLAEEQWIDPQGKTIWVYYLLVSNHAIAENTTPTYILLPGRTTSVYPEFKTGYLNYFPIMSNSGQIGVDAGILSVFGMTKVASDSMLPLGIHNLQSGVNLPTNDTYYAFSYPQETVSAQFSTSVVSIQNQVEPFTIRFTPTNTTTSLGSSGGAVCNSQGKVVAVITGHSGNKSTEFTADPLPESVLVQVNTAIETSQKLLAAYSLIKVP